MRRKKILYINHAGRMGGSVKSLAYLIKGLDKKKYIPVVLNIKDGPVVDLFKKAGAYVIVEDNTLKCFHGTTVSGMSFKMFIKNIVGLFYTAFFSKRILQEINPDIIHLNTTCMFPIAYFAKKYLPGVKVVSHVREPLLPNFFGKILKYGNLKTIDNFVAISRNDAKPFMGGTAPVEVVHNFVDFNKYKKVDTNLREELGIGKDDIVFTYLSRIQKVNGTMELLEAAKLLVKEKNIKILIVGDDKVDTESYTYDYRKIEVSNVIKLDIQSDVIPVLSITDVLVSPFTSPHFSRAVVEAGALSVPSIVSDVNSLNEQVINNKTGLIYDYANVEELAESIKLLALEKKMREKMGAEAYKFIHSNFNAEFNVKKTLKAYE